MPPNPYGYQYQYEWQAASWQGRHEEEPAMSTTPSPFDKAIEHYENMYKTAQKYEESLGKVKQIVALLEFAYDQRKKFLAGQLPGSLNPAEQLYIAVDLRHALIVDNQGSIWENTEDSVWQSKWVGKMPSGHTIEMIFTKALKVGATPRVH